jgi:hypothetical protein
MDSDEGVAEVLQEGIGNTSTKPAKLSKRKQVIITAVYF